MSKIKDIPYPRVRKAHQLNTISSGNNNWNEYNQISVGFNWKDSLEGYDFWNLISLGKYEEAKKYQPHLFIATEELEHKFIDGRDPRPYMIEGNYYKASRKHEVEDYVILKWKVVGYSNHEEKYAPWVEKSLSNSEFWNITKPSKDEIATLDVYIKYSECAPIEGKENTKNLTYEESIGRWFSYEGNKYAAFYQMKNGYSYGVNTTGKEFNRLGCRCKEGRISLTNEEVIERLRPWIEKEFPIDCQAKSIMTNRTFPIWSHEIELIKGGYITLLKWTLIDNKGKVRLERIDTPSARSETPAKDVINELYTSKEKSSSPKLIKAFVPSDKKKKSTLPKVTHQVRIIQRGQTIK